MMSLLQTGVNPIMKIKSDTIQRDPLDLPFRELLSEALRESGKTRERIASELSHRVGRTITASILNDYTARTKEAYKFPAAWMGAILEITGSEKLRRFLLTPQIQALLSLAECELTIQHKTRAKTDLVNSILVHRNEPGR
jgi:hypothetical protein